MCFLYIIKNNNDKYYISITKLRPEARLLRHNRGEVYSTKYFRPWTLVCTKEFNDYKEARETEKKIKSWRGGNAFKKFLSKTAGSSNGRTAAFSARGGLAFGEEAVHK